MKIHSALAVGYKTVEGYIFFETKGMVEKQFYVSVTALRIEEEAILLKESSDS